MTGVPMTGAGNSGAAAPRCGVFVYGSMVSPEAMATILGRKASEGTDYYRAVLRGWRRRWNVCTDNTTARAVHYYTPGTRIRPAVQVLFLNLVPADEAVTGRVLLLDGPALGALDAREANYDRVAVTGHLEPAGPPVVWTYVGKPAGVRAAEDGLRQGTARIRREYLSAVEAAVAGDPDMRAELRATLTPPPAAVESLTRVRPVCPSPGGGHTPG